MKKSRYSGSQIIGILKQAEAGTPVTDLCREHGMSDATFYEWGPSRELALNSRHLALLTTLLNLNEQKIISTRASESN